MGEIVVLTKVNCGECKKLKTFVDKALKPNEKEKFNFIVMEEQEELFNELAEKYNVQSLPVLIKDDVAMQYTTNPLIKKLAQ